MQRIRDSLLIVVVLLVIAQFLLNLLARYASATVPFFLTEHPWIILVSIPTLIGVTAVLTWKLSITKSLSASPVMRHAEHSTQGVGGKMNGHKYDVFISYSHKDSDWVNTVLLLWLRDRAFRVLIDTDFRGGKFGVLQMQDGVTDAKRVLAVFTPDYFQSDWATLENVMTQILDPATRQRKLIPILVKDTTIPLRLAGIHYRDLRSTDETEWEKLAQDLM